MLNVENNIKNSHLQKFENKYVKFFIFKVLIEKFEK